ncbi:hypothetical protein HBB16_09170 [Pseudonocardia sp. MCCB 268]|nr:hypothetical protein [Pseudonocardia cytotoxica]
MTGVDSVTLGLLNCHDPRPEQARALVERGADLLRRALPGSTAHVKELHWELLLRARAVENTCYVLAASQSRRRPRPLSMGCRPDGACHGHLHRGRGHRHRRPVPALLHEVRRIVPCLQPPLHGSADGGERHGSRRGGGVHRPDGGVQEASHHLGRAPVGPFE